MEQGVVSEFVVPDDLCVPHVSFEASDAFLEYLAADGMWLPKDAYPPVQDETNEDDEEEKEEKGAVVSDEAAEKAVGEALRRWKSVTVKLGSVSPTDCAWMMPFSCARCTTLGHVYMALKSSDRIQDVLRDEKKKAESRRIKIQQWIDAPPSGEWRCYTRGTQLAFAGQRYPTNGINIDFAATAALLKRLWNAKQIGERIFGSACSNADDVFEVDIWVAESGDSLYVLGARKPSAQVVEDWGVFSWEELTQTPISDDSDVIIRALTGKTAMATSSGSSSTGRPLEFTGMLDVADELNQMFGERTKKEN